MNYRASVVLVACALVLGNSQPPAAWSAEGDPTRDEALAAMRRATAFFVDQVATPAGYHGRYTQTQSDTGTAQLSGHQPETVQGATPAVGLAFLAAWEATGDRVFLDAAQGAAHGMLHAQMCSGGWDERVTELDPEKRKEYEFRADGGCRSAEEWSRDRYQPHETADRQVTVRRNMTNLDNNITQSIVRMLIRVDRALGFEDKAVHEGALHALDYLVLAQYPIGAWPRNYEKLGDPARFPVLPASYPKIWSRTWTRPAFYSWYIMNDDCTLNVMDAMFEAARIYNEPRYKAAAEKAGVFILLAQMPEPQPAWAQQYTPQMHPVWARSMEPPAVVGRESVSILYALLTLYRETGKRRYLQPIPRAVEYLKSCVYEKNGRRVIARFHELKTNRRLYISPGSPDVRKITYSDEKVRRGYTFATSAEPLDDIAAEYDRLVAADPATVRRANKLAGLKPFVHRTPLPLSEAERREGVRAAIATLDERGAWVEPATDPSSATRTISSHRFVRNMKLLGDHVAAGR